MYKEVKGDLIRMAQIGSFDVVGHGVNCFNAQAGGLAPLMVKAFRTDKFVKEHRNLEGDINKLGTIDWKLVSLADAHFLSEDFADDEDTIYVVNCYTQYNPGADANYAALTLCMKKINHVFKGKHIGLPKIGAGIGGLDWIKVRRIIKRELKECNVTVVILP